MNFKNCFCAGFYTRERTPEDYTVGELEDAICEITEKQNYISNCGLSEEVTSLAIKELEQQKKELKEIMHKKVDEL